jgi:hypothetical protein
MNREIRLLRVCYWWGILADAVMAVLMLFPGLFVRFMRIDLAPGPGFSYGLRTCTVDSLMIVAGGTRTRLRLRTRRLHVQAL